MGTVKIKYQSGSLEHVWQNGDALNEVPSSGMLSLTTTDAEVIDLRLFETEHAGEVARESLAGKIATGIASGGTTVIDIDDDL